MHPEHPNGRSGRLSFPEVAVILLSIFSFFVSLVDIPSAFDTPFIRVFLNLLSPADIVRFRVMGLLSSSLLIDDVIISIIRFGLKNNIFAIYSPFP
jgi:hypothetical protein